MKEAVEQVIFEEKFRCPECKNRFLIRVKDKILKAAVRAEKVRCVVVERDSQKSISEVV